MVLLITLFICERFGNKAEHTTSMEEESIELISEKVLNQFIHKLFWSLDPFTVFSNIEKCNSFNHPSDTTKETEEALGSATFIDLFITSLVESSMKQHGHGREERGLLKLIS